MNSFAANPELVYQLIKNPTGLASPNTFSMSFENLKRLSSRFKGKKAFEMGKLRRRGSPSSPF